MTPQPATSRPQLGHAPRIPKFLRKRVDAALDDLAKRRVGDEDIHSARKSLKKARAALRLLRPGTSNARYRSLNAKLRDAARPLSQVRDSKVLLDTLRSLQRRHDKSMRSLQLAGFKHALDAERTKLAHQITAPRNGALAHSRGLLRDCLRDAEHLPTDSTTQWAIVADGLQRVYRKGRRAMAEARRSGEPAAFHEWRKQVKYLRYELELLEPLWPALVGELADQAHKLSDYLGDEHDLTVLAETAAARHDLFRDEAALSQLRSLVTKRQTALRERSLLLGARLFADKPQAFARRFEKYWKELLQDRGRRH